MHDIIPTRYIKFILMKYIQCDDQSEHVTQRELAQMTGVSLGKVNELIRAFEEGYTPHELTRKGQAGLPKASGVMTEELKAELFLIAVQPNALYLAEMADALFDKTGVNVNVSTVCRTLRELGFTHKKIFKRAMEADVAAQQAFRLLVREVYVAEQLVFLDEVGTTNKTSQRTHAFAPLGERTKVKLPQKKEKRISALGVLSDGDGLIDWYIVDGGMGSLDYIEALKFSVLPHLNPFPGRNSVVVLDNNGGGSNKRT